MNPHKPRYRTTNWPEYNRSLQNRGNLTVWLSPDISWLGGRTGVNGRQPVYTDAAIQTVLTLKALFKLALRQARGLVCSVLRLLGLEWPVPCFSTVSRRQATLTVNIPVRRRTEPLHLLLDSTGLKLCGEGEWKVKKHGAEYRRAWRKVHLAIDVETLDVRAVEMTDHRQGDAAQAEERLSQLGPAESLASVSGDGAYDTRGFIGRFTRGVRQSSCRRGAMVSLGKTALILPKLETPPWRLPGIWGGGYGRSGAASIGAAWSRPPWGA